MLNVAAGIVLLPLAVYLFLSFCLFVCRLPVSGEIKMDSKLSLDDSAQKGV